MQDRRDNRAILTRLWFAAGLCAACAGGGQRVERAKAPAQPPEAPPVEVATPCEPGAEDNAEIERGLDEICRVDPAACPTLDLNVESARPPSDRVYAVSQSTSASGGPEILLTGPLAGASAVSPTTAWRRGRRRVLPAVCAGAPWFRPRWLRTQSRWLGSPWRTAAVRSGR